MSKPGIHVLRIGLLCFGAMVAMRGIGHAQIASLPVVTAGAEISVQIGVSQPVTAGYVELQNPYIAAGALRQEKAAQLRMKPTGVVARGTDLQRRPSANVGVSLLAGRSGGTVPMIQATAVPSQDSFSSLSASMGEAAAYAGDTSKGGTSSPRRLGPPESPRDALMVRKLAYATPSASTLSLAPPSRQFLGAPASPAQRGPARQSTTRRSYRDQLHGPASRGTGAFGSGAGASPNEPFNQESHPTGPI